MGRPEATIQIAKDMTVRLEMLSQEQKSVFDARKTELEEKRQTLVRQHRDERQKLRETQHSNWQHKQQAWWNNFNTGVRALFDRIMGKRRKIEQRNEQDAWHVKMGQQQECDALVFQQLETRRTLQSRIERLEQLEVQRREHNRDRPPPRQRAPDWSR